MKRFVLLSLCVMALAALIGCGKGEGDKNKCSWSNTKSKFPTKASFREYIKDSIVCPDHNVTLAQDDKFNPGCETSWKILHAVDRMLADDWCERDVRRVVDMMRQGRRMMETLEGVKACSPGNGRVKLDFFIMSLCPYGIQYAVNTLPEMIRETGDTLDWTPHYMVELKDGKYTSMHGEAEVQEDKAQLCIFRNWGRRKWLDYMACFQQTVSQSKVSGDGAVAAANRTCVEKTGIDATQFKMCIDTQVNGYLAEEYKLSHAGGVEGSPTAIYNCNKRIVGAVPFQMVKPNICELYPARSMPEACKL